ncbi:MAG: aldo/keto reductase [Spirochaetota bacterium]|nr:aldo/keto reductase [Spirochaetota bacterium]
MDEKDYKTSDRREFLKKASLISLSTIGLSYCGKENKIESKIYNDRELPGSSRIMSYRSLGKTGLKVSDISFGAGGLFDHKLALRAIELGVNYFDTAPDYGSGKSEINLGKALKEMSGSRNKVVITSKLCRLGGYPSHMYNEKKETYISAVEGSLKRLQTDYIDFILVHALGEKDSNSNEVNRLKDSEMLSAVEKLKKDGKIRYVGVSCHNYNAGLGGGVDYAIDSSKFDLVMLAYNFKGHASDRKTLASIIKLSRKAHNKGLAFVAMKTLKGAKGLDSSTLEGKGTYAQAAFKWVLSNPAISCLVVTMKDYDEINEYVKASGQKFSYNDKKILYQAASYLDKECQIGCSACEPACPEGVKVSDILRYNMYFKNYDQEKHAMLKYSYLPESMRVKKCNDCECACEKVCPYGVAVKSKLIEAHDNLSFA